MATAVAVTTAGMNLNSGVEEDDHVFNYALWGIAGGLFVTIALGTLLFKRMSVLFF